MLSLVSSLSSCLDHEFHPCSSPLVLAFTKVAIHSLLSEHKGPLSTKWKTLMGAGQEDSNPDGDPCKPACHFWGGHSLGCQMQMLQWTQRGNSPKSWGPPRVSGTLLDHHWLSAPPSFASWMPLSDEDLVSGTEVESCSSKSSRREPDVVHPPPSDFQDMCWNPWLHVTYKDLVPMTRLFWM